MSSDKKHMPAAWLNTGIARGGEVIFDPPPATSTHQQWEPLYSKEQFDNAFKEGLIKAIYVAQGERGLADLAYSPEVAGIYKMAASNLLCMLVDEICMCGDETLIELQAKYL